MICFLLDNDTLHQNTYFFVTSASKYAPISFFKTGAFFCDPLRKDRTALASVLLIDLDGTVSSKPIGKHKSIMGWDYQEDFWFGLSGEEFVKVVDAVCNDAWLIVNDVHVDKWSQEGE